jgi:hypothetical protein
MKNTKASTTSGISTSSTVFMSDDNDFAHFPGSRTGKRWFHQW